MNPREDWARFIYGVHRSEVVGFVRMDDVRDMAFFCTGFYSMFMGRRFWASFVKGSESEGDFLYCGINDIYVSFELCCLAVLKLG